MTATRTPLGIAAKLALSLAFALTLASAATALAAAPAQALTLTLGQFYEGGPEDDLTDVTKVTFSNNYVARATVDEGRYTIQARGIGGTKVTVDSVEHDDSEDGIERRYSFYLTVKPRDITSKRCDGLFKGRSYSIGMLYGNTAYDRKFPKDYYGDESEDAYQACNTSRFVLRNGRFVSGSGYKVVDSGKKVRFTRTGKVTVRYRAAHGKVYRIKVSNVHSTGTLKRGASKAIKARLLVPRSLRISSTKLTWDAKDGTYGYKVKFSAKNSHGVRIASSCVVYYRDGRIKTTL
ncbi:MAG: hypothetical protein Q4D06_07885 [Coriobacteriia bacterium]|nr:hypothetical protein [Coriobacteriia bacterium]